MLSNRISVFLIILLFFPAPGWGFVRLLENSTGARPLSLGNAYVGLSDDGAGLFTNSAGLAGLNKLNLTSLYSQLNADVALASFGAVLPGVWGGVVSFGYRNQSQSNYPISNEVTTAFTQDLLASYSRFFKQNLAWGINLRLVSTGLSKDISGFEYLNGSGYALDLGLKHFNRPGLQTGLSIKNLIGGFSFRDGKSDVLPMMVAAGGALKILGENGLKRYQNHSVLASLDLSKSADEKQYLFHLGVEWEPMEILALRFGVDQSPKGGQAYNDLTFGVGLKYAGITFDYAQKHQADPNTFQTVTQYFSLGYVGVKEKKPASPEAAAVLMITPAAVPSAEGAGLADVKLVKFKDVPKNHWARAEIELLATAGLLRGYPNRTFQPNKKLTRREFETMVSSARQLPPTLVPEPDKLVSRREAFRRLDLTGQLDRPNDPLTRAEAAIFFSKTSFGEAAIKRLPPLEP